MMMDTTVDNDGTAFICPECNFCGRTLPELMTHLNEAHVEETARKSIAPTGTFSSSNGTTEKRSRRKPAFSHQKIISQVPPRQSPTLSKQQNQLNIESDSNDLWTGMTNTDNNGNHIHATYFTASNDDSSLSMISDENANFSMNSKTFLNSTATQKKTPVALHSILSQQRPIAPKNGSSLTSKIPPSSSPTFVAANASNITPWLNSSPIEEVFSYYSQNNSLQPFRKNFRCRMCRLTYKNFHDCTAHIRKKHEISHAQAGSYVEKLDTDVTLPPSAMGNYKIRVKVKPSPTQSIEETPFLATRRSSISPSVMNESRKLLQCKYCSFTSSLAKEITQHQTTVHPHLTPSVIKKEDQTKAETVMNSYESHQSTPSAFFIDTVRAFGEVIDINDNSNDNDDDHFESQDEEIILEDDEDDEDEALWKYQQEINDLSGVDPLSVGFGQSQPELLPRFKKFQCPHCEHSAPTLTKLKLHVATHINIKPFMCSICGWRANLRWYIQCHAKKRHPNMNFEVLQLSNEEAEQTINAYMKERGLENKYNGGLDAKRRYQCSLCQFRSNHPKFIEQHISTAHANKPYAKVIIHQSSQNKHNQTPTISNGHLTKSHSASSKDGSSFSKFMIHKPLSKPQSLDHSIRSELKPPALYNRSSLIQSDGTIILPDPSAVVYPNFSTHANFNPNRLFYCALCYRGYRWRYDVKRHHKTMHETPQDEAAMGLSMSPKSVKRRNKEFNRNFRYLEYVPQLDGLIPASMSSVHHSTGWRQEINLEDENLLKESNSHQMLDDEGDDGLRLSVTDARSVDVTEDEAAALLMIEPKKTDLSELLIQEQSDDAVIVFDDDRVIPPKEKSPSISFEMNKSVGRTSSGFKPYRCPYCFYRTNWRTDSLRHIRARHKIEPSQDGYYEMTSEEAEQTYAEYERTFGFVVSKKVLGRYTDFRHIEWKDLQKSIWEKIKDKQGYEQIILDRLRPADLDEPIVTRLSDNTVKPVVENHKRMFACMECAFQTSKLTELDKHQCSTNNQVGLNRNRGKINVLLYECKTCSYRAVRRAYVKKHVHLHQTCNKLFFYCSFCGYNHLHRNMITQHIAKHHPKENTLKATVSARRCSNGDFSIRQVQLRRSLLNRRLKEQNSSHSRIFYCPECPHISTSPLEYQHHRSCHQSVNGPAHRCNKCSFASHSILYMHQHKLLHSNSYRLFRSTMDANKLRHISVSTIFKQTLAKNRRCHCPFCEKFSSSNSSAVLRHIRMNHIDKSKNLDENVIFGSDMAKEILSLGETIAHNQQHMDVN